MSRQLIVSIPPHTRNGETAHCLMFDVVIACLPIIASSCWLFGWRALMIMLVSVASAVFYEAVTQILFMARGFKMWPLLFNLMTNEDIHVIDGSAAVTGLLLAFCMPPSVPLWIPATGAAFAIIVAKQVFGGTGNNIFNPALAARAFLLAAWPGIMTNWSAPVRYIGEAGPGIDALTSATPLAALKLQQLPPSMADLFIGTTSGCLGETSCLAILLGAGYLLYKRTVTWHIPCTCLGAVIVCALLFKQSPLVHLCSGGLMLGTFFMATDVVTSPVTTWGRIIFGCGAGVLTMTIRHFGGYPEGVCYAILIMNALSPLIEKYTTRKQVAGRIAIPLADRIFR